MEEILKQVEVGLNPQKSFTKMDKDRDVKNRIRGQVMYLNLPMVKKTSEKIRNGKTKAPKNMRMINNRFIFSLMRKSFPFGSPPMDHILGLKKVLIYKTEQMGVGTLTRLPPMGLHIVSGSFVRLPPPSRSRGSHGNEEEDDSLSLASRSGASGG